jgi:NAD(P)H dehydrogenase (quinone)
MTKSHDAFFLLSFLAILISTTNRLEAQKKGVEVLIVYYSGTGNTEKMAMAVAEGAKKDSEVVVATKKVNEVTKEDLLGADGLILGSPTYYANMAGAMKTFIDDWSFKYNVYLRDKIGGAFATGAGRTGGKEHVVSSLLLAMLNDGMIVVGPVYDEGKYGAFGASALTNDSQKGISEDEFGDARLLGERVAAVAKQFKLKQ